jgi:hypothetical protein
MFLALGDTPFAHPWGLYGIGVAFVLVLIWAAIGKR